MQKFKKSNANPILGDATTGTLFDVLVQKEGAETANISAKPLCREPLQKMTLFNKISICDNSANKKPIRTNGLL